MDERRPPESRSNFRSRRDSQFFEHSLGVMPRRVDADAKRRRYFGVGCPSCEEPRNLQLPPRESRGLAVGFVIDRHNANVSTRTRVARLRGVIARDNPIGVSLQVKENITG